LATRRHGMSYPDFEGSEEDTIAPLASTAGQAQIGKYGCHTL